MEDEEKRKVALMQNNTGRAFEICAQQNETKFRDLYLIMCRNLKTDTASLRPSGRIKTLQAEIDVIMVSFLPCPLITVVHWFLFLFLLFIHLAS